MPGKGWALRSPPQGRPAAPDAVPRHRARAPPDPRQRRQPGLIDTPAYSKLGASPETVEAWGHDVPLGRVGYPADVAEAVAFLASDAASYVTGNNVIVSGGMGVHPAS